MLENTDTLLALAEIAAAFAGFACIFGNNFIFHNSTFLTENYKYKVNKYNERIPSIIFNYVSAGDRNDYHSLLTSENG